MVTKCGLGMQLGACILFLQLIMGPLIVRGESKSATELTTAQRCKQNDQHKMGMWGDDDPNVYYICDPETNMPLQLRCPEGRGFFNGLGYYGCIPFERWPACIPPDVHQQQEKTGQKVQCDVEHLLEPWETSDPNKFYMCVDTAHEPILVNCEIGRGFVSVTSGVGSGSNTAKIVGCAIWAKWRAYMQCEQYY